MVANIAGAITIPHSCFLNPITTSPICAKLAAAKTNYSAEPLHTKGATTVSNPNGSAREAYIM